MPLRISLSAYNLFFAEQRESILKLKADGNAPIDYPEEGFISFQSLAICIGARWNALSEEEKAQYEVKAQEKATQHGASPRNKRKRDDEADAAVGHNKRSSVEVLFKRTEAMDDGFTEKMGELKREMTETNDSALKKAMPGLNRKFDDLSQNMDLMRKKIKDIKHEQQNSEQKLKLLLHTEFERLEAKSEENYQRLERINEWHHQRIMEAIAGMQLQGVGVLCKVMCENSMDAVEGVGLTQKKPAVHGHETKDREYVLNSEVDVLAHSKSPKRMRMTPLEISKACPQEGSVGHVDEMRDVEDVLDSESDVLVRIKSPNRLTFLDMYKPGSRQEESVVHADEKKDTEDALDSEMDVLSRVQGRHVSLRINCPVRMNLLELYKEFYGLGEFKGLPVEGGFYALEVRFQRKWREAWCYSAADNSFFGRVKVLMVAMSASAGVKEGELTDAVLQKAAEWQPYLNNGGLSGCLRHLQAVGLVPTKNQKRKRGEGFSPKNQG